MRRARACERVGGAERGFRGPASDAVGVPAGAKPLGFILESPASMIVVIGAGVVGLASAVAIARRGAPVCVIERHPRPGLETSTHNSGVIHAGLYYPADSLKARLCVEGRDRLYRFCVEKNVPHIKCGKLVVAQKEESAALERVLAHTTANGVTVTHVDREFVKNREPHVAAEEALWSPETGWLDAEAYVRALDAELARHDGAVLTGTSVVAIESRADGRLTVVTPRERIDAAAVVNAAGLHADEISRLAGGEPFQIFPCRGEYAELAPKARHLACCRGGSGSALPLAAKARTAWRHGLRLGLDCSACCANLMLVLLVLGVMDLLAMAVVTAAITVERLAPAGLRTARAVGVIGIAAGLLLIAQSLSGRL